MLLGILVLRIPSDPPPLLAVDLRAVAVVKKEAGTVLLAGVGEELLRL